MARNWWFKFDFRVWRTDSDLRRCSLETRGFWLEVLCIMHETEEPVLTGSYEELARLVGCESAEVARCVAELKRTNTADVTLGNGFVTLVSRRLKRELSDREKTRLRVQRHRCNADVTVQSKSKSKKKEKEEESKPPSAARQEGDDLAPMVDQRKNHPALVTVQSITHRYPPKEIWDDIIDHVGAIDIDSVRMRKCFTTWVSRGFNKVNYDWLFDWYVNNRIPDAGNKINGTANKSYQDRRAELAREQFKIESDLRQRIRERDRGLSGAAISDNSRQLQPFRPDAD